MSDGDPVKVQLCGREVPLYPQRIGHVKRKILGGLADAQKAADGFQITDIDRGAYQLLCRLAPTVPKYVPEHVFLGYATPEALAADEWDETADESPTIPELRAVISAALRVSGLDLVGELRHLVNPQWLQAIVTELLADAIEEMRTSTSSANSRSPNPGSQPLTSSTTPPPTSMGNGDSHSPASNGSSKDSHVAQPVSATTSA